MPRTPESSRMDSEWAAAPPAELCRRIHMQLDWVDSCGAAAGLRYMRYTYAFTPLVGLEVPASCADPCIISALYALLL